MRACGISGNQEANCVDSSQACVTVKEPNQGGTGMDAGEGASANNSQCPSEWHLQSKDEPVMILGFVQIGKTTTTECVPNSSDNTWLIIAGIVILVLILFVVYLLTKPNKSGKKRR